MTPGDRAGGRAPTATGASGRPVHPDHARLLRLLTLKGAVASVALSHDESCICTTCRAAAGDGEAFAQIVYTVGLDDDPPLPPAA